MATTRQVHGVDFSGASNAGEHIWIASGQRDGDTLRIDTCVEAHTLPHGETARDPCMSALTKFVERNPSSIFGFDFPFAIPDDITNLADWETFVLDFSDSFDDPDHFFDTCISRGAALPGEHVEYKRQTEINADTPWCAYNWRIRHQTYYGIGTLLANFVHNENARILPMQPPAHDLPWIVEVCPSCTLGNYSLPRTGYKGSGTQHEHRRTDIVDGLESNQISLSEDVRETAIQNTGGDALDSIIAADAAARALEADVRPVGIEGRIYV